MRRKNAHMLSILLFAGLLAGVAPHAQSEENSKSAPIAITADKLDYDKTSDVYTAVGHVKIEYEGVRLDADKVVLNNKTGEATAEGNVLVQDKGDMTRADKLQININTRAGVMYKGDVFKKKENLHVKGDVIERRSETVYYVEKGIITTCDENEWYFKGDELNVDMDRYATGKDVTFNVLGLPVLYSPYLLFPVKRQTGFLVPEVGFSSVDGFSILNKFFWAISDYRDMTIYSDYRAKTGLGTGLEYRYMNSIESGGQIFAEVWDMFNSSAVRETEFGHETDQWRWEFRLQHHEEFTDDLSLRLDVNQVSEFNYYHDLYKPLEWKAKPYLDSNAFFVERWNAAALQVLGQYSTNLTQSNVNTIQKLPEIRYLVFQEPLGGPLYINFDGSAVNFIKQGGDSMRRADFNPSLSAVFGSSGLALTPQLGARATFYDQSGTGVADTTAGREFVYAGVTANSRLSRVYGTDSDEGIGRVRHSIETTVAYNYIPPFNYQKIPQFDSVDSVVSMSTATVSLVNRITAHYKESKDAPNFRNFDLVVFRLSQSYNLAEMKGPGVNSSHPSPIQGDITLNAPKLFSLTASGSYEPDTGHLLSNTETASLTTEMVRLDLSYQSTQSSTPATEYVIAGGSLKLGKWLLTAQESYDIANKTNTQTELRVHYGSQCWGITISLIRSPGESRVTAMIDLKGLNSNVTK